MHLTTKLSSRPNNYCQSLDREENESRDPADPTIKRCYEKLSCDFNGIPGRTSYRRGCTVNHKISFSDFDFEEFARNDNFIWKLLTFNQSRPNNLKTR